MGLLVFQVMGYTGFGRAEKQTEHVLMKPHGAGRRGGGCKAGDFTKFSESAAHELRVAFFVDGVGRHILAGEDEVALVGDNPLDGFALGELHGPVSYTHLTLPTNREV